MLNELISQIENYRAFDEFEAVERLAFINFLKRNDDALDRSNLIAHVTASSWIVNKDFTKALMCYHNIYKSWSWTGGHADGEPNLMKVALREAREETGVEHFNVLNSTFYDVEVIPVPSHYKRGMPVGNHLHLNATYLLVADESEPLRIKEDENSMVAWLAVEDLDSIVTEKDMLPIYHRLQEKALLLKKHFSSA